MASLLHRMPYDSFKGTTTPPNSDLNSAPTNSYQSSPGRPVMGTLLKDKSVKLGQNDEARRIMMGASSIDSNFVSAEKLVERHCSTQLNLLAFISGSFMNTNIKGLEIQTRDGNWTLCPMRKPHHPLDASRFPSMVIPGSFQNPVKGPAKTARDLILKTFGASHPVLRAMLLHGMSRAAKDATYLSQTDWNAAQGIISGYDKAVRQNFAKGDFTVDKLRDFITTCQAFRTSPACANDFHKDPLYYWHFFKDTAEHCLLILSGSTSAKSHSTLSQPKWHYRPLGVLGFERAALSDATTPCLLAASFSELLNMAVTQSARRDPEIVGEHIYNREILTPQPDIDLG